jgi:hypothetical protein
MYVHMPFGHIEARVDSRDPRKLGRSGALEINRRVRGRRS